MRDVTHLQRSIMPEVQRERASAVTAVASNTISWTMISFTSSDLDEIYPRLN